MRRHREYLGAGQFSAHPTATLKALAHIYAGWGLSQDFYRAELFRSELGAADLETFLRTQWEEGFLACHPANLYAQLLTWSESDLSANEAYGGDLTKALQSIRARVLLLPSETDLYFRVADNNSELSHLARGELTVIPSVFGHRAGSPHGLEHECGFLRSAVRTLLDT